MDREHPTSSALDALARAASGDLTRGVDIPARYLRDWSVAMTSGTPLALIRPPSTAVVSAVLAACHERGIPVVPQGGLTGLVGGATPIDQCVIVSLERMTGIEDLDRAAATMTVRAGTPLEAVQQAAAEADLFFPLDLGARGSSQVGGLIATNAGGNRVIRYGMMRDLVLGLEVVLADGTVVTALNTLLKNNAGLDVRQVFVGSEGTLGVVTRAVLRLHPRPRSRATAFCAVASYERALALLQRARSASAGSLSAFEVMWPDYYGMVTSRVPGLPRPLPAGAPLYVLLDVLGGDPSADQARFEAMLASAAEVDIITDAAIAQSDTEALDFWKVRDATGEFPRMFWPHVAFDIGIPTRHIGSFVDACAPLLRARWPDMETAFYGHIGDSNLHLCAKAVPTGPQPEEAVEDLVYGLVREWHGTVSAEHGIGLHKRPYLSYCRSPEEIAVMRALKQALDPKGILNPGKIFTGTTGTTGKTGTSGTTGTTGTGK
jgi:FAD/FMN-containing dehydrogenase